MLVLRNRSLVPLRFNPDLDTDQYPDMEFEEIDGYEDENGEEFCLDVVVRIPEYQIAYIAEIAKRTKLPLQSIAQEYIFMGYVAGICADHGNYSDLEICFGLTRYIAK